MQFHPTCDITFKSCSQTSIKLTSYCHAFSSCTTHHSNTAPSCHAMEYLYSTVADGRRGEHMAAQPTVYHDAILATSPYSCRERKENTNAYKHSLNKAHHNKVITTLHLYLNWFCIGYHGQIYPSNQSLLPTHYCLIKILLNMPGYQLPG